MYAAQPKKLLIMNILDILRRYSDENHRLSQKDIIDLLQREYEMKADRKSVSRNLTDLMDAGYSINYSQSVRMMPNKKTGEPEENVMLSDFYLDRDFTDGELRLLIDSLLFSKHIPYSQCKELVEKLEGLSSVYFSARVKHIRTMPDNAPQNRQIFLTIETLDEAISNGRQVSFQYCSYGTDMRMHPKTDSEGNARIYTVSPYQIAAANGRYYLICNCEGHENIANFRLDRISDIRMLDTPARSIKSLEEAKNGFDLPRHMAEHIYMFAGESVNVSFRAEKSVLNDVVDWLGSTLEITGESDTHFTARVRINYQAMRCWALQYSRQVRVLTPQRLVDDIRADLRTAADNYVGE